MAHGHPQARSYTLGRIDSEASLVEERINAQLATEAVLLKMAISAIPNMGVKPQSTEAAGRAFEKQINKLMGN
jgi:hypothetical protein